MQLLVLNSFVFCCEIYSTSVQLEQSCKDLQRSVFEVQKISFTVLQGTNCLTEFRHIMNEISIDYFNFIQILHVLTF